MAAATRGVDPGPMIMIHGQPDRYDWPAVVLQVFDWTNGCNAVADADRDDIRQLVENGTPKEIEP